MSKTIQFMRVCLSIVAFTVWVAGSGWAAEEPAAKQKRILLLGDSWTTGMSVDGLATKGVPVKGFGSFDAVLAENGFGTCATQGAVTAWAGRESGDWAKPENLKKIAQELQTYPTIDIVHYVIGGNDVLNIAAKSGKSIAAYTAQERTAMWDKIQSNIQTTVDFCLAQRPNIRVLLCDYDYFDAPKAEAAFGMNFCGATPRQLNDAFMEVGKRKLEVAKKTKRCAYVSNWGLLHHTLGYPTLGLPAPGAAPDYTPYAGGNPDFGLPPGLSVGDGIHLTDKGYRIVLQNCMDQYYKAWLKTPSPAH